MKAFAAFLVVPIVFLGLIHQPVGSEQYREPTIGTVGAVDSALVKLGRYLFFEPRLSGDGSMSCASCHDPTKSYTDGLPLSTAYPGSDGFRNTKTVLNATRAKSFYWDGRLSGDDPETQVRDAITETHFMNMDGRLMLERLKQVPEYVQMFGAAFGDGAEPSFGGALRAIVAFEKTLITGPSPYDTDDLSGAASRGRALFEGKAGCVTCHTGPDFTDGRAHDTGVPRNAAVFAQPLRHLAFRSFIKAMGVPGYMNVRTDVGRYTVTKLDEDLGRFVTPSLRQVGRTAPYMHNGVLASLTDVVNFYNAGASDIRGPLNLSTTEVAEIVAFLESLTGPEPDVEIPSLPKYQPMDRWLEVRN